uniref:Gamma-butyrobetaine hydroxylase-like N-terminal domain-containing protein n=1 Tax=Solibacter usitatus (strain Ellin6076) TaxID=234267 RepID=Q029J6_SOLUE
MTPSTDPEHIAISKSKGIKIDWKDGHHSDYGLTFLRDKCPCATCTGAHGTPPREPEANNPFQMFKPALKMLGVEPVGNYAIRINWSDGHNSGIYSYEHFRRICPCEECRKAFTQT